MSSKKIGIVGWNLGENSFGSTKAYLAYLGHFGQVIVLTPSSEIIPDLDLLVLPGGKDITSFLYGKVPSYYNSDADVMKEFFFQYSLPLYIEAGVPIFGICLGMQQINVHFGGKLIQEVGDHPYSEESRSELVHDLLYTDPWAKRMPKAKVNSLHHQAVDEKSLPDCLEIVAVSKSKGAQAVEIIRHRTLPIWGVQYHPEEIYDDPATAIISNLLKHERTRATTSLHHEATTRV